MAKEDIPPLGPVPKKRRQLEAALDVHLAMWLASDDLTPSQRRRVAEERARRRQGQARVVIGFSGAREGLTPPQRERLRRELATLAGTAPQDAEGHHGDCVGGDEQFHEECRAMGIPVVLHPPENGTLRAHCKGAARSERARPFLERNKEIVQESTVVLAAPKETREPEPARGQGTWSTVRYARRRGVALRVVMPDGELLERS